MYAQEERRAGTAPFLPVTLGMVVAFSWGKLMRVRVWPRGSQRKIIIKDVIHMYIHFHVNLPLPPQCKVASPEAPQCGRDPGTDDDDLTHP